MTPLLGPTTLLGMPDLTGPEQVQKQIEHFRELRESMYRGLDKMGKRPDVAWETAALETPQAMEMELMLRMWVFDLVQEIEAIPNPELTRILEGRTEGEYGRLFSTLPFRMLNQGLIRSWKSRAKNRAGSMSEIRYWGKRRD